MAIACCFIHSTPLIWPHTHSQMCVSLINRCWCLFLRSRTQEKLGVYLWAATNIGLLPLSPAFLGVFNLPVYYSWMNFSAADAVYNFHPFFSSPLHFSFVFADNHVVEIKTISDFPPSSSSHFLPTNLFSLLCEIIAMMMMKLSIFELYIVERLHHLYQQKKLLWTRIIIQYALDQYKVPFLYNIFLSKENIIISSQKERVERHVMQWAKNPLRRLNAVNFADDIMTDWVGI